MQYCNRDACRGCELKPQCTANTYRRVGRWTEEAVLERMEARLAARPEILKQRREIAEHPFGSIKQWMNQGTFLLRGLEKVRAEFSLTALAYNFIRVVNIVASRPSSKRCEGGWPAPAGHLTPSRRWRSVMRRPEMATALRDLILSNATRRSVSTRSGSFLRHDSDLTRPTRGARAGTSPARRILRADL